MAGSGEGRGRDQAPGPGQLGRRAGLLALVLLAGFLALQRVGEFDRRQQATFGTTSGTVRIADLSGPVEILRDDRGIPHLRAQRESEGWFGLGFTHAQDRLLQMLWFRRKAEGTTAEVAGEGALASDRLARVLEIGRAAENALSELPPASKAVLDAYASGVNARLTRLRQGREVPPQGLREPSAEIEDWRPEDSLAVVKLLSWCMGGTLETTLVLDELIQRLDSVPARPFFPNGSAVDFGVAPMLPNVPAHEARMGPLDRFAEAAPTRRLCEGIGLPSGSAWVIDGRKTESGAPMVVADWHFAPSVPAVFYEAQIEAGAMQVAGATMPGSPIFWAGRNRSVAWASVPASAPISDIFIETLRNQRTQYQNGKRWVPVEEREETLRYQDARGDLQSTSFVLRRTQHGPLLDALYGELPAGSGQLGEQSQDTEAERASLQGSEPPNQRSGMALAWTGARSGDGLTSMLRMARATSSSALVAALENHHEPVVSVAHADTEGHGGYQIAGWLAKRPLPTGIVPVQGRLRAFEWRERVPLSELPHEQLSKSGQAGWVMAADQSWQTPSGLSQMEWLWRPGDRAERLEEALAEKTKEGRLSLRAASGILSDDRSKRAPRVSAALLALARSRGPLAREAVEIADLLTRWDGSMASSSAGAAAYQLVMEEMTEALLEPALGPRLYRQYLEAPHVRPQRTVESLILRSAELRRPGGWTDEIRTAEAVRNSLRRAWIRLNHRLGPTRSRWSWGGLHRIRFASLGTAPAAEGDIAEAIPAAGGRQTVWFTAHRTGYDFDVERAPIYRVAIDLASADHLLSVLVPGQSEHPGHEHYADGLAQYGDARLPLFATNRIVVEGKESELLVLEPAP